MDNRIFNNDPESRIAIRRPEMDLAKAEAIISQAVNSLKSSYRKSYIYHAAYILYYNNRESVDYISLLFGLATLDTKSLLRSARRSVEMNIRGIIDDEYKKHGNILLAFRKKRDLDYVLSIFKRNGPENLTETPAPLLSSSPSAEERSRHLDGLIATVTKDAEYEKKAEWLTGLTHEFRQRVAVELAPALNAKIQGMEYGTLDQKKELGRWVNDQLEPLGLAVQCPNTLKPAKLRATTGSSSWPDAGRFYFETSKNGKAAKSAYSETLPALTLMDATPSQELHLPEIESETPWQDEVGPKSTRRGPKRS